MLPKVISNSIEVIRVLHVDDDPNQYEFIKFFLKQADEALNITCVGTPDEAFKELNTNEYDCFVTDFQMPEMDGITLSRKIREKHSIPIILYTGQGSEEVAESAFTIGVDDYIRKEMDPSHYKVLAKRIRHVVEKKRVESLYQNAVEGIRDGLCIVVDQNIVYANQVQADIFGVDSPEKLVGTEALSYVHTDFRKQAAQRMSNKVKGIKDSPFMKLQILRKDGTTLEVETTTSMIKYNGKDAFLVLARDLTERNKLEQERKKVEERYRTIFELAPDGIATLSLKGRVTSVNPAFLKITGYKKKEILGKWFYQLGTLRNIDLRNNISLFTSIARGRLPPPVEFVFQYKDGNQGWGEAHLAFIENNNSKELLAIVRDITERKWVENEINQNSDELKKMILERKNAELDANQFLWGKNIVSNIGVELQDSLFIINNSIFELRKDPSKLDILLDKIEQNVSLANIQLKELFENKLLVHTKDVDILGLVEKLIEEVNIPPEIEVKTNFKGIGHFKVDSNKMMQGIKNLIKNSIKMLPDGGSLKILCEISDDFLKIEIVNDGNLLIEAERLMIEGSIKTDCGLLTIKEAQKIAEEHGGSILVYSVEDIGTSYMMILPKVYRIMPQEEDLQYIESELQ